MLIFRGRVREPAAKDRSLDDAVVEEWMRAQKGGPRVSRSRAGPEIEWRGAAGNNESGGCRP